MNLHHGMKASLPVQNAVWDKRFFWVKIFVIICADNGVWNGYKGVITEQWSEQISRISFTVVHRNAEFLQKKVDVCAKFLFPVFGKKHQNAASGGQILFHFVDLKQRKKPFIAERESKGEEVSFHLKKTEFFPRTGCDEEASDLQPFNRDVIFVSGEMRKKLKIIKIKIIIWFHLFNLQKNLFSSGTIAWLMMTSKPKLETNFIYNFIYFILPQSVFVYFFIFLISTFRFEKLSRGNANPPPKRTTLTVTFKNFTVALPALTWQLSNRISISDAESWSLVGWKTLPSCFD